MDNSGTELDRIREILKSHNKGLTIAEIAKLLTLNRISTSKYLNMLVASGHAEMRIHGPSKVYYPCLRVPISTLLNFSKSLLLVMNNELTIIDANDALLNFFLIEKNDLIGHRIDYSPIAGYFDATFISRIQRALESQGSAEETSVNIHGEEFFLNIKYVPTVFESGDNGVTLIAENITEITRYRLHLEQMVDERSSELTTINDQLRKEIENHKKARNALKTSEKNYRELVQNANSIIMKLDTEGNIIFFNEFAQSFFGFTEPEILGRKGVGTIVPPQDSNGNDQTQLMADMLGNPEKFAINVNENIRKSGERAWISWTNKIIWDAQGRPTGILSIGNDITKLKQAEEELKFQNVLLTTQQETTIDGILVIDENGTFVSYNQRFVDMWGIPREILVSKDDAIALQFVHEKLAEPAKFIEKVTYLYHHRDEVSHDDILLKDGRIFERYSAPMIGLDKRYYGRIWYFRDVTEQKVAQIKLRQSEQKLSVIIDFLPDATLVIDTDGIVIAWNRAMENLTGVKKEDILGLGNYEYTVAYHGERTPLMIDLALHSEMEIPGRYSYCRREGDKVVAEMYYHPPHKPEGVYLWGIAAPLYDSTGKIIGAIETNRDITQRKKSELALKESEDRFRRAMDASTDGIWDWDITTGNGYFGPNYYRMLGYEPGEFPPTSRMWADFIHPDDREHTLAINQDCIENRCQSFETEYRMKTKDGSWKWILGRGRASSRDAQGRALRMTGTHVDITERKRAEEALRESEEIFREVFNNANDAIFLHEMTDEGPGRYLQVNDKATQLLGYTSEEFMQMSLRDIVPETILKKILPDNMKNLLKDGHMTFESVHKRKNGSTYPVEVSTHSFWLKGHDVTLSIVRDITERKRTEETLRESEEKFRSFVETSPDMIWEINLQGKVRYVSPMVNTITGYSPEELTGKTVIDLVPEQQRSFVMQELVRNISSDGPLVPFEVPIRHRNGRDLVIEIRPARITDTNGNLIGLRGVAIDITERKQAENALRQANRQLNLLGSITRHDIINKVTVILGYLGIAKKRSDDPAMEECIRKIESAIKEIRTQVEFTRVYQGLGAHEPQWQDLERILPRPDVPEIIRFNVDVHGVEVFADPMLEKVFFNLLDNSIRHGQHVTEIGLSSRQSAEGLTIIWEDNGIGIPDEEKDQIFERGYGKNTGLGLFLVREILFLTDIIIKENGMEGNGARFEIFVPNGTYRIMDNLEKLST